jgi:hypothetical protein
MVTENFIAKCYLPNPDDDKQMVIGNYFGNFV